MIQKRGISGSQPARRISSTYRVLSPVLFTFIGALLSHFMAETLKWRVEITQAVMAVIALLAVIVLCDVAIRAQKKVEQNAQQTTANIALISERLKTDYRFDFVEDMEDPTNYKGRVFATLQDEILRAKKSIRALSLASVGDPDYLPASPFHCKERDAYFRSIEELIKDQVGNGDFEYKRLFQSARSPFEVPTSYSDHVKNVVGLRRPHIRIDIRWIKTSRLTGFIIIDQQTLILMLGGVLIDRNPQRAVTRPYPTSLLIFNGGPFQNLVSTYTKYFDSLVSQGESVAAHPIDRAEDRVASPAS